MTNTDGLIKDVAFDIITLITVWGLFCNSNVNVLYYDKPYKINNTLIGLGFSTYFLTKYK